jgi:phosphonate transport system permease protein
LTGSGIGFYFSLYYNSREYPTVGIIVVSIVLVVIIIELISNKLRRVII